MKKDCKKCKYFVQHYAVGKTGLVEADCGHYKFPVSANRFKEPKQPCQNFEAKDFPLQQREAANDFEHASKHRFKAKKTARICAKLSFLRNYLTIWAKPLLFCSKFAKMISQQNYGPLVKWSRRHPLTVESGVRSSYGLPSRHNSNPQQSPAF